MCSIKNVFSIKDFIWIHCIQDFMTVLYIVTLNSIVQYILL